MRYYKDMMLATLRRERIDQVSFVPRLDLWYNANKRVGTLPDKYKNASLINIVDDLDLGYYAIVPNFRNFKDLIDDHEEK